MATQTELFTPRTHTEEIRETLRKVSGQFTFEELQDKYGLRRPELHAENDRLCKAFVRIARDELRKVGIGKNRNGNYVAIWEK